MPLKESDIQGLKPLYKDVFGIEMDKAGIKKKFQTEALGESVIGFIAYHLQSGKAAAYYGVFPLQIKWGNKIILAAQSGDTMTHSEHRKKGLFVQLAAVTFKVCFEKGIHFIYGSPNKQSFDGFTKKLGWQYAEDILVYNCKLEWKTFPAGKMFSSKEPWQKWYRRYTAFILKNYLVETPENFTNDLQTPHARVLQTKAYIDYKNDGNKYFISINNIVFWIACKDVLWIGDISDYKKVTRKDIKELKRIAFLLGYNTIRLNLNESIMLPAGFSDFKARDKDTACYYRKDGADIPEHLLWTGAVFDTW